MPDSKTHRVTAGPRSRRISSMLILALAIVVSVVVLTGCGGSSTDQATTTTAAPQTSAPETTTAAEQLTYVTLDVEEAHQQLSTNERAQIVDVREPNEWANTGVPVGAVLIPLGELEQRAPAELAKDRPVYVICNSGNRSRTGAEILLKLGYTEVYNVDGGIQAWTRAGLPVEPYTP